MIRFTMDFSENGQAGEYQITSVQFTQEKTKQEILLSDLGMDVRFGVNEQAETNPDQVLYDEDAYADVDADVVYYERRWRSYFRKHCGKCAGAGNLRGCRQCCR